MSQEKIEKDIKRKQQTEKIIKQMLPMETGHFTVSKGWTARLIESLKEIGDRIR